eukprot:TRINITY_DN14069_c0_g1_i3.p3 TRINITY_DN14069_c0_g1~~TRINITY_DN14069_c0_g1_i3.p3  ORF type:complete len:130 (+),score=13.11 TRINITY_DN14069_c0_g1_i3:1018-1407(+)
MGGFRLDLPVLVLDYDTAPTFICSAVLLIGHYLAYRFSFGKSRSKKRTKVTDNERKKRLEQKREQKLIVKAIQETMRNIAMERGLIENQTTGLIIRHALFGKHSLLERLKTQNNVRSYMEDNDLSGNEC